MKSLRLRWLMLMPLLAALPAPAAFKWPEFDAKAEFALAKPQVDPEADAEIILHETVIDDSDYQEKLIDHLFRVRIYTARGVERFSLVELTHDRNVTLSGTESRTLHPDGTVTELNRKDIFSREKFRIGKIRQTVTSFAPPALSPGVVLEYRYRERRDQSTGTAFRFRADTTSILFQSDLPTRFVSYKYRPLDVPNVAPGFSLRCINFNYPQTKLLADSKKFYTFEAKDLPAWKDEPFQPPPIQSQSALILYYSGDSAEKKPERYWANESESLHTFTKDEARGTKAIKAALAGIIAPGDTDAGKLAKIHDFCRAKILNRYRDSAGFTAKQRLDLPPNETATDTLKQGNGTSWDINALFVALAQAAGFDARLAYANDRTWILYSPSRLDPFTFDHQVAAVRQGAAWSFYDPGAGYLPAGLIDWRYCETSAIIADPKQGLIEKVPGPAATASNARRTGVFTLDENGTLEGDITATYSGYFEAEVKKSFDGTTPEEQKKQVVDEVQTRLKLAEVTEVVIENATDLLAPVKLKYHLRVPDYAERTGSRLFLQPSFFRKNKPPLFPEQTRKTLILFDHRYTELDEVTITLPEGYALEAGNAPDPLPLGEIGSYQTGITFNKTTRELRQQREFALRIPAVANKHYPVIKQVFDGLHARDNHVLTLKRTETADALAAPSTPTAATAESAL